MVYLSPTEPIVIALRPGTELFFAPGNAFRMVDHDERSATMIATAPAGVQGTFSFTEDGTPIEEIMLAHGGQTRLDFTLTSAPVEPPPVIAEVEEVSDAEEQPSPDRTTLQLGEPPKPR